MLLKKLMFLMAMGVAMPVLAQKCDSGKPATAPLNHFKVSADGTTITNIKSQQTWLRCSLGMTWTENGCEGNSLTYSLAAAEAAVDDLNTHQVAGRTTWRLPTVEELNTIVEQRCFQPAINLEVFPSSPESGFWSSTVAAGINARAWVVHFLHGQRYIANTQQSWRVRPVADK